MAKSANQKQKLLYLLQILNGQTDEEHPLSVPQLCEKLAAYGIEAERKSIYDDLEQLRQFGVEIELIRGKNGGYYVPERTFQLAELKLLVDSVQSSKFITHKKSMELIKKLEGLTSIHQAQKLRRQVFVAGRIKSMNESVYYNIDYIHEAINAEKQIGFRYYEYTVQKERRYRHDGQEYHISPFALVWDDENYYMVGYDAAAGRLKHYRVDKMTGIRLLDAAREGDESFRRLDTAAYSRKMFSMFAGEEETVHLRFSENLIGVVLDRFGKDITVFPREKGSFEVYVKVALSPQFYGWLFAFGDDVKILSPQSAIDGMTELLDKTKAQYK